MQTKKNVATVSATETTEQTSIQSLYNNHNEQLDEVTLETECSEQAGALTFHLQASTYVNLMF